MFNRRKISIHECNQCHSQYLFRHTIEKDYPIILKLFETHEPHECRISDLV